MERNGQRFRKDMAAEVGSKGEWVKGRERKVRGVCPGSEAVCVHRDYAGYRVQASWRMAGGHQAWLAWQDM